MEKLHDNDEMEIDLIEILYALKKGLLSFWPRCLQEL